MKVVRKHIVKPATALSVSNSSIARFFVPTSKIVRSSPSECIRPAKVSKQPMIWHSQVTPPPAVNLSKLISVDTKYDDDY